MPTPEEREAKARKARQARLLHDLNKDVQRDIAHLDDVQWYERYQSRPQYRIAPERLEIIQHRRSNDAEQVAKQYFADLGRDEELKTKRASILLQWARSNDHIRAEVDWEARERPSTAEALYRRYRKLIHNFCANWALIPDHPISDDECRPQLQITLA